MCASPQLSVKDYCWLSSADHSKWVISTQGATICIGDNNRSKSQTKRSGAIVSTNEAYLITYHYNRLDNQHLHDTLNNMIAYRIKKIDVPNTKEPFFPPPADGDLTSHNSALIYLLSIC